MDIHYYLQRFESTMRSITVEDPLEAWDKFVVFLDGMLPPVEKENMTVVMERLVQTFMQDQRYHHDPRFINHCIRYASHHPDPESVYTQVHSVGVGTRAASLYISWAQQCERRNLYTQAEQIYHKALENQAEPLNTLQHHYTLCKSRTGRSHTTATVSAPLHDSQLVNQQLRRRDRVQPQCTDVVSSQCPAVRTVRIISRSENNPPTRTSVTECVSMYCVSELVCEGSELSFEELRAQRYFTKLKQQELQRQQQEMMRRYQEEEEEVVRMKKLLEELNSKLTDEPQLQQVPAGPHSLQNTEETPFPGDPSETVSAACVCEPVLTHHPDTSLSQRLQHTLSLSLHTHTHSLTQPGKPTAQSVCECREEPHAEADSHAQHHDTLERSDVLVSEEPEGDVNSEGSHRSFSHHSHVTPNTSLGLISATPSRALPSPTVNTREALDLIGNMFQGPTLLQDTLFNTTHNTAAEEDSFERNCRLTGVAPSSAPFRIYQEENHENGGVDSQVVVKPKPVAHRGLIEIPLSKDNVTPQGAESLTDDSTMWGSGHAPMTSFPNRTQDFALSAHLVSTPLHPLPPYCRDTQYSHVEAGVEENPYLRQPAKLSPILEQSPLEEKEKQCAAEESTLRVQGSIMGTCESVQEHVHSLVHFSQSSSSISVSRPALASFSVLAPLKFPDQSITTSQELRATTKPSWSVYQSPSTNIKSDGDLTSKEHLNSNILNKPDQLTSSSFTSHTQNLNQDLLADPQVSHTELDSSRLHLFGERRPEKPNSRSLSAFMELNPDKDHPNHSQQSDLEEADVLLPEVSFNMHRSESLLLENPQVYQRKSFMVLRSPDPVSRAGQDVPMSPEPAPGFGWLQVESPVQISESDLDVKLESSHQTSRPGLNFHSEQHSSSLLERSGILLPKRSFGRRKSEKKLFSSFKTSQEWRSSDPVQDVLMSPAAEPGLNWISSESPVQEMEEDLDVMVTPQLNRKASARLNVLEVSLKLGCGDVPMSPASPTSSPTSSVLVSDPWDDEVIASLLAGLHPSLNSYPNLSTWSCCVPPIAPKLTVQMGDKCLRVDGVVGQGAFATVYQATELDTSHKLILKVQKPSSPWEFYMNTQLDWRVEPHARHLYHQLHAAHLYSNGSVLLGELHTCGTLLNVVNLYKSRSEKVIPQPLVMYFTMCILDMVERLHTSHIIHADIKPDNFLLGERFLQNKNLSEENMDHGLVLIDFGQSIDVTLFPAGVQFTAHCMTSGFQCTEMLSGRPWTYQTDYFGIAGTVYCMLFGSYMKVRNDGGVWSSGGVFKRKPHSDLWQELFHVLLNIPDRTSLPRLRVLRDRVSAALLEHYATKLLGLKNQLVVQILESRSSRR
ncbi:mitotic checkpoint serine/threonine-protein kinase BUB1 isoform X3 [Silurus meridionalis]|uniref:mitotic checkpoint serine/threonine-protein kinase BUB1 isoform X3 n=1 Tax=Silurus meridionalis TaxID=175797 RepID=UPI001EEABF97|nr:mitotic checkpoint serine/threonine-protein kinase BUB1 isoform X3 [Silurus meridionalis]